MRARRWLTDCERSSRGLVGRSIDDADVATIQRNLVALNPIDDVRATADYRRRAAAELVRRALQSCGGGG